MCEDAAAGMAYLEEKGCIHRWETALHLFGQFKRSFHVPLPWCAEIWLRGIAWWMKRTTLQRSPTLECLERTRNTRFQAAWSRFPSNGRLQKPSTMVSVVISCSVLPSISLSWLILSLFQAHTRLPATYGALASSCGRCLPLGSSPTRDWPTPRPWKRWTRATACLLRMAVRRLSTTWCFSAGMRSLAIGRSLANSNRNSIVSVLPPRGDNSPSPLFAPLGRSSVFHILCRCCCLHSSHAALSTADVNYSTCYCSCFNNCLQKTVSGWGWSSLNLKVLSRFPHF